MNVWTISSGSEGVQTKVTERATLTLFINCYAHRLSLVLTQEASKLKECEIFFGHLNGLAAFFLVHLGAQNYWIQFASSTSVMWHQYGCSTHPQLPIQSLRR